MVFGVRIRNIKEQRDTYLRLKNFDELEDVCKKLNDGDPNRELYKGLLRNDIFIYKDKYSYSLAQKFSARLVNSRTYEDLWMDKASWEYFTEEYPHKSYQYTQVAMCREPEE